MHGIAGGTTAATTGALSVGVTMGATVSERASGRNASAIKSEFREVVGEGAFCKHGDKLGIVKREGNGMLFLVMSWHCEHSCRRSAQQDCSCCSCVPRSALVNWIEVCSCDRKYGINVR